MDVLYFEVGKYPRVVQVEGLEGMQRLVDGYIGASYPFNELAALVVNDDGLSLNLSFNRIVGPSPIVGNFFIAGIGDEDFISLPPELVKKFSEKFYYPEIAIRDSSAPYGISGIPMSETIYAHFVGRNPANSPER